ncbi:MAG: phosphonate ABC transporter, permease protein PhnE [Spirochaeta sp.]|nr:phosphonate ABC transporter, permease protein PhnE [Spirochaeta sp.]
MVNTNTKQISGTAAALLSLIVPGLGQILAGQLRRGILLFMSLLSIMVLGSWRVHLLAHRELGWAAKLIKAAGRRPFFVIITLVCALLLWLWIAWDARRQTDKKRQGGAGIFVLVLVLFFSLGWQISQIDVVKMVAELPDAWPPLSKILWPWQRAFTRATDVVGARADMLIGCDEDPLPYPVEMPGQPYIKAEPNCGDLSTLDENNKVVKGTVITLTGRGFAPNTFTEIWWADSLGNEFRPRQDREYTAVQTDAAGAFEFKLVMPYRLIPPSAAGRQVHRVEARQVTEVGGLIPADPLKLTIERMAETIFMGMMATLFGIIFSIPISFLAARNLMSGSWITMTVYYVTRTILNIIRAIEPLIWALIAVVWVGLGPFAGIVALTIHSIAALGKLYSEAIESIDPGPIEAIRATGANHLQTIMFAVVPQMIPPFVSFSIYRWDINVRMSTVIGLVGGGGIGFLLVQYIRLLDYRAAGIAVWFIAVTVSILDYVSAEIRARFI